MDVTSTYQPFVRVDQFDERDEEHNNWLASQGYFSTHPYGTKYLYGCKVITYNSLEDLRADYSDRSSKLWKEYNDLRDAAVSLIPGGVYTSAYQNPLADVADVNDNSRETFVSISNEWCQPDTTPLPPLSNYLN